jgi:hypothetical protein
MCLFLARRDAEGKVILGPRNFTGKKTKLGHLDSVLLSKPSYVSIEDPFKHAIQKTLRDDVHDGHKKAGHEVAFKPAKVVKEKIYQAPYEHMNDRVEVKKEYRDADGAVKTEPKNFYTWKPKMGKVGKRCFFNGQPEHIPDDYNWPKK